LTLLNEKENKINWHQYSSTLVTPVINCIYTYFVSQGHGGHLKCDNQITFVL